MKPQLILFFLTIFVFAVSCEKDDDPDESQIVKKEKIDGVVQKGPYVNGTSITVSELDKNLTQTGKTFSTQISDNKGSFEVQQLELSSRFIELKADGFYFDEVRGQPSSAQLTLYALSDLTDKNSLNVNILSHLERNRVKYLVSQGAEFSEAKKTAQEEILNIFSLENPELAESELLDISKEGDDNAMLLAISVILKGFRTDAELSELLANISSDILEDGELNNPEYGSALINHALLLDLPEIRQNLLSRYQETGVDVIIPDFEKYVQIFLDSSDYEFTQFIEYPEYSNYGENILFGDKDVFIADKAYSMAANLPTATDLKIILRGGLWYFNVLPDGPVNWTFTTYNSGTEFQTFTSTEPGKNCDLKIYFSLPQPEVSRDTITIEYYENLSESPTRIKKIIIE